jgi:TfoX/Sxy family transcriptional regulator of competence genes
MAYSESLAQRMRAQLDGIPLMVEKKMFGGIGFILNGNMACGIIDDDLIVRLGAEQYEEAIKKPAVSIFNKFDRPMKGWVMVAPSGCASDEALHEWIQLGISFAQALPAK